MKFKIIIFGFLVVSWFSSCESFVEVDTPKNQISSENVFANDVTATAAVNGIYAEMMSNGGFASGSVNSVTVLSGLSSDDFTSTLSSPASRAFSNVSILPNNSSLEAGLWDEPYRQIYYCNLMIEGLLKSTLISDATRTQLIGEVKFIRAFCYFYLVNLFGDVPLATVTDFNVNTKLPRESEEVILDKIEEDLLDAKQLLGEEYPTGIERVKPNRYVASALLARLYLYEHKWQNSLSEADFVISNTTLYQLQSDLSKVFLANSSEAIWQLKPVLPVGNTGEASIFILMSDPIDAIYLSQNLLESFDPNDKRKGEWIGEYLGSDGKSYFYPYKYKVNSGTELIEYSAVFRLAEQYLIRAEAKANLGDLSSAISDVDVVRGRAGVDLIGDINPSISSSDLFLVIEKERRLELFSEWGHRWFDLKRTPSINVPGRTRADDILSEVKGQYWQSTDVLYPIPLLQLTNDPAMTESQNPGY